MSRIKQISFFLALSIIINWGCTVLQSYEFFKYLRENIVILLITILAINTATISVVIAKLYEIAKTHNTNFNSTISEVKISLIEQIILIILSSIFTILYNSAVIKASFPQHEDFFNIMFTFIFIYAIDIVRDTGIAIFDILKFPNQNHKE